MIENTLRWAFSPSSSNELGIFYFLWMLLFLIINILWDIYSHHTENFNIRNISSKTSIVMHAATFSNSFLILLATIQPDVEKAAGDLKIPLIMAGMIGIMFSLSGLSPHDK